MYIYFKKGLSILEVLKLEVIKAFASDWSMRRFLTINIAIMVIIGRLTL